MSKYYLKPHVTDEMLQAVGFDVRRKTNQSNWYECAIFVRKEDDVEIFIPLEICKYGNRLIQYNVYGYNAGEMDEAHIEMLIEKGYVEVRND